MLCLQLKSNSSLNKINQPDIIWLFKWSVRQWNSTGAGWFLANVKYRHIQQLSTMNLQYLIRNTNWGTLRVLWVALPDFPLLKIYICKHPNDSLWSMERSLILCLSVAKPVLHLKIQSCVFNPLTLSDGYRWADMVLLKKCCPLVTTHLTSMINGKLP